MLVGDQLHEGMHGSDRYKAKLNRLVDELGIREKCLFVGNQERVEEYYRACDLTVLPSLHEGMPNVILESLASGIPVIATDVADNNLLIGENEVGLLVPSEDPARLREAISRLAGDAELRRRYGANAVGWIRENYSSLIMARKMGEAYLSLIERADARISREAPAR
jgi:glycosyltransferase involved in cell wall biosynthesis